MGEHFLSLGFTLQAISFRQRFPSTNEAIGSDRFLSQSIILKWCNIRDTCRHITQGLELTTIMLTNLVTRLSLRRVLELMQTCFINFQQILILISPFLRAKALASIRDATSSLSTGFLYQLSKEINLNFTINTPHHYLLSVLGKWGDTKYCIYIQNVFYVQKYYIQWDDFKESTGAIQLESFKLSADLECDESNFVYPTTFHIQGILLKMLALHAQVMSTNAKRDPIVMAQIDCIARLTKTVYGGAKVVYDDKARSVEMARYGVFWKAQKNFLLGLELNQVGDQRMVEGIINHKVNGTTQLGSSITLDLDKRVVSTRSVIEKRFDDATVFKGRVDNNGLFDVSLTGQLDPTFSATFSTGGSLSNVINGQARCADSVQKSQQTYAGVSFTFTPI